MLEFLRELRSIEIIGAHAAALSRDNDYKSVTAQLFGQPENVLTAAISACLRAHESR